MAYATFWVLASIVMLSAFFVISSRNPVHSVLWLILSFFTTAALFVLIGAEFLAMLLVVVYVGAVAVLFLFVVMMLDVDFSELRVGALRYWPAAALIGGVFLLELFLVSRASTAGLEAAMMDASPPVVETAGEGDRVLLNPTNIEAIGAVMYTRYALLFQMAGIILLVAMLGAIVLTLRQDTDMRRQNIAQQTRRNPDDAIRMAQPAPGKEVGFERDIGRPGDEKRRKKRRPEETDA